MAAGVPHLEIPNYPGPVQHNANLGEREAHLSLSLVHYLSIGFGRLPNLMRIFISGDGYDRVWLAMFCVRTMSISPDGYRVCSNFDGSIFVSFHDANRVRDFEARVIVCGAQIVSTFLCVHVVYPAINDPYRAANIIYLN